MLVICNQFDLAFEQFSEAVHRRARKRRGDRLSVVDFSDSCFPLPFPSLADDKRDIHRHRQRNGTLNAIQSCCVDDREFDLCLIIERTA